jgi:hypothetical protein
MVFAPADPFQRSARKSSMKHLRPALALSAAALLSAAVAGVAVFCGLGRRETTEARKAIAHMRRIQYLPTFQR